MYSLHIHIPINSFVVYISYIIYSKIISTDTSISSFLFLGIEPSCSNIWSLTLVFNRVLKFPGILCVIGMYFVLMRQLLMDFWITSGWMPVIRKTKPGLEARNFQLHSHPLWRREELEIELMIDHECLMKPPKIPKVRDSEICCVGKHISMPKVWHILIPLEEKFLYSRPFQTLL